MGWPGPYPNLSQETIYILERCPWKGNVRELRNLMTRVATLLPRNTNRIFPFHMLPYIDNADMLSPETDEESRKNGIFIPAGTKLGDAEEMIIQEALKQTNGNKTKAASLLGVSLRNLRRKLNR